MYNARSGRTCAVGIHLGRALDFTGNNLAHSLSQDAEHCRPFRPPVKKWAHQLPGTDRWRTLSSTVVAFTGQAKVSLWVPGRGQ